MLKRKSSELLISQTAPKTKVSKSNSLVPEDDSKKDINELNSTSWLLSLPNEVLELISSFLSPRDLSVVASLECGRFSDVAKKARFADFSSCNDIDPGEFWNFFSKSVMQHIREINFSCIFLVNSSDLVKAIMHCKRLTCLTVIECGVMFHHMKRILTQCKLLKELYWNVLATVGEHDNMLVNQDLKIRKLYLHVDCPKSSEIGFYLLKRCPSISEANFNFTSFMSPHLPLRTCQKNIVYKLHSHPICPVNIILDDYYQNMQSVYECIMATKWCSCSNPIGSLHMPMTTPYLQIIASTEEYPSLTSIPDKSVQKLVLHYSNAHFLQQKMSDICRVVGKNLTVLAVKKRLIFQEENDAIELDEEKILMSPLVSNLITGCCNIQALILSPICFTEPLKLEALHCLKGLKTLGLSSCAFKNNLPLNVHDPKIFTSQQKRFDELVENIKYVEHFSIIDCEWACSDRGPRDKELLGISKWNRLKSLSIVNVDSLKYCPFLKNIATECPNFKSLEIVDTVSYLTHLYIANVQILLQNSPQLMQLCIYLDVLCIQNARFWESISSAKSLQSLCLTMLKCRNVCPRSILKAIENLPLLHLFHLNSKNIDEGFASRVTRIMKRHGVKNPKVEMTTIPREPSNQTICDSPHIYIA